MKTLTKLILGSFFILFSFTVSSQTTFKIDTMQVDSGLVTYHCLGQGRSAYLYAIFDLNGYTAGDSVDVLVNWDDGNVDQRRFPIYGSSQQNYCTASFQHIYSAAGSYVQKMWATAPDNKKDSFVSKSTSIVYVCGNVSGTAYFDPNNNCTKDAGEKSVSYGYVELTNKTSGLKSHAYIDRNGKYSIDLPTNALFDINIVSNYFSMTCPTNGHTSVLPPSSNNDFGVQCPSGFDLTGEVKGWAFRPGWALPFWGWPQNGTCNAKTGKFKVIIADPLISYSSSWGNYPAPTVSGDTLIWNFSNLDYTNFYLNRIIYGFKLYTDTTAQLGDTICIDMIIEPSSGDNDPSNNVKTFCFEVNTSYDPNNKVGYPLGLGEEKIIEPGTGLDYTINFQNTGTDTAFKVVIVDTIPETLDLSTLTVNATSHDMNLYIDDNRRVKFEFLNIQLPDSNVNEPESHGFVNFSIDQMPSLDLGTRIENTAYIYFDYNEAIITNTEFHTVDIPSGLLEGKRPEASFKMYPNPAKNLLIIEDDSDELKQLNIRNIQGALVLEGNTSSRRNEMDVSDLPSGLYFVEMLRSDERQVQKLMIE